MYFAVNIWLAGLRLLGSFLQLSDASLVYFAVSNSACWFAPSRFTSSAPDDEDICSSPQLVGLVSFVLVQLYSCLILFQSAC